MNLWDVLILAAVAAAVFFAVRRVRKKGACSCGCQGCSGNCASCSSACGKRRKK